MTYPRLPGPLCVFRWRFGTHSLDFVPPPPFTLPRWPRPRSPRQSSIYTDVVLEWVGPTRICPLGKSQFNAQLTVSLVAIWPLYKSFNRDLYSGPIATIQVTI